MTEEERQAMLAELRNEAEADRLAYKELRRGYEVARKARLTEDQREHRRQQRIQYHRDTSKYWTKYKTAMRRTRRAMLVEIMGNKCVDCGGIFPPFVYDIHHLDPAKKDFTLSNMPQRKWETILKEIEGCILLCSNCHRLRHHAATEPED
jgi:hypothetical protein